MTHVLALLPRYGYLVVFGIVLLENLGLPLPGVVVLVGAGGLAGLGQLRLAAVGLLAVAAALLGDLVWYGLGRWRGRPVLGLLCRLSLNPDACMDATEQFLLRHGMPTLLVAKFLPGVNTIVPPLLGTLRARLGAFVVWDLGGAALYTVTATGAGYLLGWKFADAVTAGMVQVGRVLGSAVTALVIGWVAWRLVVRLRVQRVLRRVGLTPVELRDLQESGADVLVLDVRAPLAVRDNPCRIAGAVAADAERFERLAATLPRDRLIVTYCV
jgi:membrane protein DedA with SNARE-associated domain